MIALPTVRRVMGAKYQECCNFLLAGSPRVCTCFTHLRSSKRRFTRARSVVAGNGNTSKYSGLERSSPFSQFRVSSNLAARPSEVAG
jgi:hypothetical protein